MADKQSSRVVVKINGQEKGYKEKGGADKQEEPTFPWVLPTNQPLEPKIVQMEEFKIEAEQKKPKAKKKFKVHKSISGLLIAIVVGCIFGLVLLNVVKTNNSEQEQVRGAGGSIKANETVTIRPLQFYGLQAGVYSSQKSASEDQKIFEQKGITTVSIYQDDKWFLLVGAFNKKENSTSFQQALKEKGVNTFGKIFIVNGGQGKGVEGERLATQHLFLEKLINGGVDEKIVDSFKKEVKKDNDEKAFLIAVEQYMNVKDSDDKEKTQSALLKLVEMYSTFKK